MTLETDVDKLKSENNDLIKTNYKIVQKYDEVSTKLEGYKVFKIKQEEELEEINKK